MLSQTHFGGERIATGIAPFQVGKYPITFANGVEVPSGIQLRRIKLAVSDFSGLLTSRVTVEQWFEPTFLLQRK
jgi:hypothetical protein